MTQGAGDAGRDTGIRVLHVDDDPQTTELVERLLGGDRWGFEVDTANSAREGLGRFLTCEFDCVVSDYDMPDMDGIAFFERLRAGGCDAPGILFTGHAAEPRVREASAHGVVATVSKGSGFEQFEMLAASIEQVVS